MFAISSSNASGSMLIKKSSGISLAFSAAAGSSFQDSGTLSDHGRNESTTSSVSSPVLGISVSSHST